MASCSAAEADSKLAKDRFLLAAAVGALAGGLMFGVVLWFSLWVVESCFGSIGAFLSATTLGGLVAYRVARVVAADLNWYTCRECGVRFRCAFPVWQCGRRAEKADRAAAEHALADFAKPLRERRDSERDG